MEDDDLDPTDMDELDGFSVKPLSAIGAPSAFAVKGPAFDYQAEANRQGEAAAADLGKSYDTYAARLRAMRLGPSKKDMAIDALAAFAQPTRSGRIGEALANSGAGLAAMRQQTRAAEQAREQQLAQAGFQRDLEMAKLRQAYGLKGLDVSGRIAAKQATSGITRPLKITHFATDLGVIAAVTTATPEGGLKTEYFKATAGGQPTGAPIAPPANMQPIASPAAAPPEAAPGAVPPPPAPPTAADAVAPVQPPGVVPERKLGEQWTAPDGNTYQQTLNGPKKIADPTPEFLAAKAGQEKVATEEASKSVGLKYDLKEKAREVAPIVSVVNDASQLIRSGQVITGIGAKQRLVALKAAAIAGDKEAAAKVAATEQFINATSRQLATIIKQFGSGTAISDSDRAMAEKIAGSDITLEADSIKWILDLQKRLNDITLKAATTPDQAKTELERRRAAPRKTLRWNPQTGKIE